MLTRFEPEEPGFDLRVYYRAAYEANETIMAACLNWKKASSTSRIGRANHERRLARAYRALQVRVRGRL
jgi:hypothetical protein